jgi:hypothetical protein
MAKVFSFSGVLWTDRTIFYPEPQQYAQLYPSSTPFLSAAMARLDNASPVLQSPDYKFFEHRAGWRYQYLDYNDGTPATWTVAGAPNDTLSKAVTVDNATGLSVDQSLVGSLFEVWDSTLNTYKGTAYCSAVTNTTTITLKSAGNPAVSTEATAALADNDRFYLVGRAFGEETTAPEALSDELEVVWNSCFLSRTSVEIGRTLQEASLRGETNELQRLRMLRGNDHKMNIARSMYFMNRPGGIGGVAHGAGGGTDSTFVNHITDANSKTVRTTMGLFPAMRRYGRTSGDQQNWFNQSKASFTYNKWVDMSEKIFQYDDGQGMKEAYVGPGALSHFAKIGAEGFITASGSREPLRMSETRTSSIGLNYKIVDTPHGPIRLIPDPLLRGTPYNDTMLIITPSNTSIVRYEQSQYHTNIKTEDNPRVIKDEFVDFLGLKTTILEGNTVVNLT